MPVRSLNSSVHRWPDAEAVLAAARAWAERLARSADSVVAVGCFGSYARGDAGVGSDLDLIVIVRNADGGFDPKGEAWAVEDLPVPAERIVYTTREWEQLPRASPRFHATLAKEARWLHGQPP